MDHCKFSVCSGIQYTILPRLTLAVYTLLRSDEGVVGKQGRSQAAFHTAWLFFFLLQGS
jgi:hypothetical protein